MTMLVTGEECEQDRKSEWCQLADLMARGGGTDQRLCWPGYSPLILLSGEIMMRERPVWRVCDRD